MSSLFQSHWHNRKICSENVHKNKRMIARRQHNVFCGGNDPTGVCLKTELKLSIKLIAYLRAASTDVK